VTAGLNALDGAGLGGTVLCLLVAWRRGRHAELVALVGCLAVYLGGSWAAAALAPAVPVGTPGGPLNLAGALVVVFVAGLLGTWLLARLGPLLVKRRATTAAERALAAAFGVLRAWVLGLMAATVVGLTPAAQSALWQGSALAGWLGAGVRGAQPLLPPPLVRHLAR
jgi:uncharacterized membrane protein required for colicin V production